MKKNLFALLAVVLGAFAFVSCEKEKDEKNDAKSEYLTLEEQQQSINTAVTKVAESIDFSGFQPVIDAIAPLLKNYDLVDIIENLRIDSVGDHVEFRLPVKTEKDLFFKLMIPDFDLDSDDEGMGFSLPDKIYGALMYGSESLMGVSADLKEFSENSVKISATINILDLIISAEANADRAKGAELTFDCKLNGISLAKGSLKLDADFPEIDPEYDTDEIIIAWLMDAKKCRSLSLDMQLMEGQVKFVGRLDNPMGDMKASAAISDLMSNRRLTQEQYDKLVEALTPFIKADFYYNGYEKAQASLTSVYKKTSLFSKMKNDIQNTRLGSALLAKVGGDDEFIGSSLIRELENMNISLAVKIHNAKNENEKVVSLADFFEKIDFETASNKILAQVEKVFGPVIDWFLAQIGDDAD